MPSYVERRTSLSVLHCICVSCMSNENSGETSLEGVIRCPGKMSRGECHFGSRNFYNFSVGSVLLLPIDALHILFLCSTSMHCCIGIYNIVHGRLTNCERPTAIACCVCSGDSGDFAMPRWSTDHAPCPVRLLVKLRHDGQRPRRLRLPVAADRRCRTAHQSNAHQLRSRQPADRLVSHAGPDPGRCCEAETEDLLPAGESARTPVQPRVDGVRGFTANVARVLVFVQRDGRRHYRRQSPQSSLPASLPR